MFQFQIFDVLIGTTALTLIIRRFFCPCSPNATKRNPGITVRSAVFPNVVSLHQGYKLAHPPVFSVWS